MKRHQIVLVILLLAVNLIHSKKMGTLTDVVNPYSISIGGEKIYIVEGFKVYIYSLTDLKLIKKFGKKGEGPEEFRVTPMTNMGNIGVEVYSKFILVNSLGKLSYFSKDGKYQREISSAGTWRSFKLLENKFVGFGGVNRVKNIRSVILKIYGSVKEQGLKFFEQQMFFNPGEVNPFFMPGPAFYTFEGKIYVEKDKDIIQVFNHKGKHISSLNINKGYKKIPVTLKDKNKFIDYFKKEPAFKSLYERIKRDIKFFKYFPGIYFFNLADEKIYVFRWNSWDSDKDKRDVSVFDLNGKLLKNTSVPFHMKDMMVPYAYTIKGGVIYQLVENEDDEGKWDLHASTIK